MRTQHIERYYTASERLVELFESTRRRCSFSAKTKAQFARWKRTTRKELARITGIDRVAHCDPQPELLDSEQQDGYLREKWLIQTEPGVFMPFYVLRPTDGNEADKKPCVIATHGHASGGKLSPAGRRDIEAVAETIEEHNYDYGVQFVKQGYIVFCPDARGFGERREWTKQGDSEDVFLHSSCIELNHMEISLGRSLTGMWTWDLMRLVDYIGTRADCDSSRLAIAGLSGGGLQALWTAAFDDRIRCAVVSGYFYGYRDALLKLCGNCGCNYVPHLWETVDMGDIGALIAPRPLLIETGDEDPLNGERGVKNVVEQLDVTRAAYRIFGAEDRILHHVYHGPHVWNGEKTYDFVRSNIGSAGIT